MKAKISQKKEISRGTLLVTFDLLGNKINFKPGQYFFVTIPKLLFPDSRGNMRHFTLVNSPNENGVITMATRIREESGFKKSLNELSIGSEVEIGAITGNFTLPKDCKNSLVFIAGGIGITPFISMLKYAQDESLPYNITLIYSNRDQQSSAFLDELNEFRNSIKNLNVVLTMTQDLSWKGENRRIDHQFIKDHVSDFENKSFYVSGPPAFNTVVVGILKELKIKNILTENFVGY
jgi:glycine betaine catabolism B